MDRVTVACVQQRMRLPATLDEYREDLRRFLRAAQVKNVRLVVFPELGGVMVMPPLLRDLRSTLLKQADQGRRKHASLWQKLRGTAASTAGRLLNAQLRTSFAGLLEQHPSDVATTYHDLFAGLAREFAITLVAPSGYLPDPSDGVVRALAVVFGPNGERLGQQAKVVLHPADEGLAQPGTTWDVIQTEVGALGLMLGSDVLYPEVGRLLAYQGAEILLAVGACADVALYQKVRAGMLARMQENQLFGLVSFLIGSNELAPSTLSPNGLNHRQAEPFVGKSAIFAPQELTPRFNGVLVEMGNLRSEGVLTAEWDFVALKRLWENSETPVRRTLPLAQAGQALAKLYESLRALPRMIEPSRLLAEPVAPTATPSAPTATAPLLSVEDLPVLSAITRRWPLVRNLYDLHDETVDSEDSEDSEDREDREDQPSTFLLDDRELADFNQQSYLEVPKNSEDETDEMDALADSELSNSALSDSVPDEPESKIER